MTTEHNSSEVSGGSACDPGTLAKPRQRASGLDRMGEGIGGCTVDRKSDPAGILLLVEDHERRAVELETLAEDLEYVLDAVERVRQLARLHGRLASHWRKAAGGAR